VRVVLSPRAQADIDDIWEYTVERWGVRQAEIYVRLIKAAVEAVGADPGLGQNYDYVRSGYRRYMVGSHVVLYRVTAALIVVVRILHQRMDVERHI
jgi:toxin ParE1/3/4